MFFLPLPRIVLENGTLHSILVGGYVTIARSSFLVRRACKRHGGGEILVRLTTHVNILRHLPPTGEEALQHSYTAYFRAIRFLLMYIVACGLIFKLVELCETWQNSHNFGVPFHVVRQFQQRSVNDSDVVNMKVAGQLSYRFRPPPMMAASQSIPLVVFLHGSGECGDDNIQQLRTVPVALCDPLIVDDFPCAILVPQCPQDSSWMSGIAGGFTILDLLDYMCDEVLEDGRIDSHRVYLIGYSMGSFGAWSWAAHSPSRFAAIVPIAGGGDPSTGSAFKDLPVWAVHGADDKVVSVEQTQGIIRAIREAGGMPKYSEVAGLGHNSWRELFGNDSAILRWLFNQKQ